MRRLLPLLLSVLLLAGCASPAAPKEEGAKRYEATFLTLFDTVTTVVGYAESEEDFQATAQSLHDVLLEYTSSMTSTATMTAWSTSRR